MTLLYYSQIPNKDLILMHNNSIIHFVYSSVRVCQEMKIICLIWFLKMLNFEKIAIIPCPSFHIFQCLSFFKMLSFLLILILFFFSVKNLNWLTSQQALADIASFITSMNQEHNIKGRWIALGESFLFYRKMLTFPLYLGLLGTVAFNLSARRAQTLTPSSPLFLIEI